MLIFTLLMFFLLRPLTGMCFPENIRNGYVNCTVCHYSPAGGGLLTPYGRELSREVMSTWGEEGKEVQPLYGLLDRPSWADWGGDLRAAQIYRDTPYVREARFIPMQMDLEGAVFFLKDPSPALGNRAAVVATMGVLPERQAGDIRYKGGSRRHYLLYKISPTLTMRVGKFLRTFGLNVPDHIISTKRGLNFDQGSETYNGELSHIGQRLSLFLTGILGRPDKRELQREKGVAFQGSYAFFNRLRVGGNYFYGTQDRGQRHLWGLFGMMGFTPQFYLLSEWDFQRYHPKKGGVPISGGRTHRWGQYFYHKLGFEWWKGFHTFFSFDKSEADFKETGTSTYSLGPGLIWYPRPHFETSLTWLKQRNRALGNDFSDFSYLMLHFYF